MRDPREFVDGLSQRHRDVIGLGLIAAAFFLAFVLYLGWDGGRVGGWLADGLENAFGLVSYVVPIALAAWGGSLIARPLIRTPPALNVGAILVLAALLLAYAAQTAGIGPDHPVRHDPFEQKFMIAHGGAVGEGLYWASTTLFQRLGAHILVVLMLISGTLLLTGTTVTTFLGRTGRALRKAGTGTRELTRTVRAQRAAAPDPWEAAPDAPITISRERETETFETERLAAELDGDEEETIAVHEGEEPEWAAEDEIPGPVDEPARWGFRRLSSHGIGGGTTEMQRNAIAEHTLGLPHRA